MIILRTMYREKKVIVLNVFKLAALVGFISFFSIMAKADHHLTKAMNYESQVYVTLKMAGSIFDLSNNKTWAGEKAMLYNSLFPDGKHLVVTSPALGSIFIFDTETGSIVKSVKTGKEPKGVKISPNGKEIYVTNEGENTISVVSIPDYGVVATIPVGKKPHNARFTSDAKLAYVTYQGEGKIGVIDTSTRQVIKTINVVGMETPHNLDLSPDEKTAYIRDTENRVAILDLTNDLVVKLIEVGLGHAGIDVSPDGKFVVTGAIGDSVVTVIDTESMSVVKSIEVGFGPHGLRFDKDSKMVYVAVSAEDKITILDSTTWKIVAEHKTAEMPFWIAVPGNF